MFLLRHHLFHAYGMNDKLMLDEAWSRTYMSKVVTSDVYRNGLVKLCK